MAKTIFQHHKQNKAVYGICGGYQIMGKEITDPKQVEGDIPAIPGLGILPVKTVLSPEKTTEQCTFSFLDNDQNCKGYEIHMGETYREGGEALCIIHGKYEDGCYMNSKTWGTYIHGIFDNSSVINQILNKNNSTEAAPDFNYETFKQEQYDKLADLVRQHSDMDLIYKNLEAEL